MHASSSSHRHRPHDHHGHDCGDDEAHCCGLGEFVRLRYAYGLRLGAVELTDEQGYLIGKQRFHNRRCHGPGILCGLRIDRFVPMLDPSCDERTTMLRVRRGAALDGCGHEVLVACDQCIDVAAWFGECREKLKIEERPERLRLWVGLRYHECPSDPSAAPRDPCGCDSGGCAYTRVREGFELRLFLGEPPRRGRGVFPPPHELLRALAHEGMPASERRGEELLERIERLVAHACPDCCDDDWLCLGCFEAILDCDAPKGPKIVDLCVPEDSELCRPILLSTAALQTIVLDLADVASAAGLFGMGPTVSRLRFESDHEWEGTLIIDVRLLRDDDGEPSPLAHATFVPEFVRVHRFEHHEARWENITPRTAYHIRCERDHISIRWGRDDHRLRPGAYRVSLASPEAAPIVDHRMRPLRPGRFARNFALEFVDGSLRLTDVRL
jgi:hypothetical protein